MTVKADRETTGATPTLVASLLVSGHFLEIQESCSDSTWLRDHLKEEHFLCAVSPIVHDKRG